MLSEQALTVATLGMGSVASAGGEMASSVAAETVGGAETTSTLVHDAVFWSGRAGANRAAAEASGLTTLEQTSAGRAMEKQDLFSKLPYEEAMIPIEQLSRQFASEASGTVNAWTGSASPMSVWSRIEKPTLRKGVGSVIWIIWCQVGYF